VTAQNNCRVPRVPVELGCWEKFSIVFNFLRAEVLQVRKNLSPQDSAVVLWILVGHTHLWKQ
jgi:hypothetical protein